MKDEMGFLRELLDKPGDTTTRLVYADWLDERGDVRGEFLRLELRLNELPEHDERRPWILDRLRELRQEIDPKWLARLDQTDVENCQLRFAYQCPQRWEKLKRTTSPAVRFCDSCQENVYHCTTIEEAREHARCGHCVAVDSRLARTPNDLPTPEEEAFLGDVEVDGLLEDDLDEE
jgi:uncharacterized protein (TIGR02996 family)